MIKDGRYDWAIMRQTEVDREDRRETHGPEVLMTRVYACAVKVSMMYIYVWDGTVMIL